MHGMRSKVAKDRLREFTAAHQSQPLEILSYDVAGHDNRTAVAVSHFIYGFAVKAKVNGATKEYRYPGFIERDGVVWLGQSVLLLTPERASELRVFLEAKGVAHWGIRVETR